MKKSVIAANDPSTIGLLTGTLHIPEGPLWQFLNDRQVAERTLAADREAIKKAWRGAIENRYADGLERPGDTN